MIGKYDSENGKLSFLDLQLKLNTLEDGKLNIFLKKYIYINLYFR